MEQIQKELLTMSSIKRLIVSGGLVWAAVMLSYLFFGSVNTFV